MVFADRYPDLPGWTSYSIEETLAAAVAVETAVQERLRALGEGATIDRRFGRGLWQAQWQAREAVYAKTGERKVLQQRVADGSPALTVCAGRARRRFPESVMRFNAPDMFTDDEHPGYVPFVPHGYGDGCFAIIRDTTEPRRPKRYCAKCRSKDGLTLNAGLAKSSLARLRAGRRV